MCIYLLHVLVCNVFVLGHLIKFKVTASNMGQQPSTVAQGKPLYNVMWNFLHLHIYAVVVTRLQYTAMK